MRHELGWSDLAGARVGVFGAGIEGRSAILRLRELTDELCVVDDDASVIVEDIEVVASDRGGLELLGSCDVVIKAPGISAYRPDVLGLEAAGVAVVGGVGLSLHELDRSRVVCVTGTKGKSTTVSVLGHLLAGLGARVEVTGNIGRPPFDPSVPTDLDVLVIETSSFQALDIADAPGVVAVSSLAVDHVDWHGSAVRYQHDKLSLTSLPGAGITIAQGASAALRRHEALLGGELRWVEGAAGPWAEGLGLLGKHNLANAEIARSILVALGIEGAEDPDALAAAAAGFEGLPGRLSEVAVIGPVRFIDDSLATNVLSTLAALDSFEGERLAILVGGHDRGVDYAALIEALSERPAPTLVVGLPESGSRLVAAVEATGSDSEVAMATDVATATAIAAAWAAPGGVVLLSPAAPSFSQFRSWRERSAAFAEAIASL